MSRTVIDLNDKLVADVAGLLGTRTTAETVDAALRDVLETRKPIAALARLRSAVAAGAIDLTLIEGKAIRRRPVS
jgi:Arc/MetJ family transcription regulator